MHVQHGKTLEFYSQGFSRHFLFGNYTFTGMFFLIGTRSQECTTYNMKKYRGEKSRSHIVTPIVTVSSWINGSERTIWNQIVTDGVKQFSYWMPNIGTIAN